MNTPTLPPSHRQTFRLHLSTPSEQARERAEEVERASKRREYWQTYKARIKRVFGTLPPQEHDAWKAEAETNGRTLWDHIISQARAYRDQVILPTKQIEEQQRQLLIELRRAGNNLNHLVLVLPAQPRLDRIALQPILQDLGDQLSERFAPEQLTWGRAHFDTDHPHIHLMISANNVRSKTRRRLDKADFAQIQRELETYKAQRFPELVDVPIYNRFTTPQRAILTSKEGELVRRTQQPSRKRTMRSTVYEQMRRSSHLAELEAHLQQAGLMLYERGQHWGVIDQASGRRYRLKTLGLEPEFKALKAEPVNDHRQTKAPITVHDPRVEQLLQSRQVLETEASKELDHFERGDEL